MGDEECLLPEEEIRYAHDYHIIIRGNFQRRVLRLHMKMRPEQRDLPCPEPDPTADRRERLAVYQVPRVREKPCLPPSI